MKWLGTGLALVVLTLNAPAAEVVTAGTIKSIDAANSSFVLTDSADKQSTIKFGTDVVVNRDGKEAKNGLEVGDIVHVCHDSGLFTWTSHYILVLNGVSKNSMLIRGHLKNYDVDKKEMTFTNAAKQDSTYPMGQATVRRNMEDTKIGEITIGDQALLIVNRVNGVSTLQAMMVDRAK